MQIVFILMDSDRIDGHWANLNNHTFEFSFLKGFSVCFRFTAWSLCLPLTAPTTYIFLSTLQCVMCVLLYLSLSEFTYARRYLCFHM